VLLSMVATFLIGFIFVVSDRFGSEILIGTLPVKRKDIVLSRYLISIILELNHNFDRSCSFFGNLLSIVYIWRK
jgi:hypothetical protein